MALAANEFLEEDVNKFVDLARLDQPVGILSKATDGELERGQQPARAGVLADAVNQIVGRVAGWIESSRVTEHGFVAVRGGPVQLDRSSLRQPDPAEVHRTGGDAAVGDKRIVDPQNLVDDLVQLRIGDTLT